MPRVRQLPELYIRGSLANETMRNLTEEERLEADKITRRIVNNPVITCHKIEFIHRLRVTIGGDYFDKEAAYQEFYIAVWRGVVEILFHHKYEFRCIHCNATTYKTKSNTVVPIQQRYPICPACNHVMVAMPGDSKYDIGTCILFSEAIKISEELISSGLKPIIHTTCILSNKIGKKYDCPEAILNDDNQIYQFFGTWIWNYFGQILAENKVAKHIQEPMVSAGSADTVATDHLVSSLRELTSGAGPQGENVRVDPINQDIICNVLHIPPSGLIIKINKLVNLLGKCDVVVNGDIYKIVSDGIIIEFKHGCISIKSTAPRYLESTIRSTDEIQSVSTVYSHNSEIDVTKELQQMSAGNNISQIDETDMLTTVRAALPEHVRPVFDLITNGAVEDGKQLYNAFVEQYPNSQAASTGIPFLNKMAEYLGRSVKEVKRNQQIIKSYMIVLDVTPSNIN